MQAILITTENKISIVDVTAPLHKSIGELVGGLVEHVNPRNLKHPYCMLVNESGLCDNLPLNRIGSYLYQTYKHGCPIVGNIVIMKEDNYDWYGLEPRELDHLIHDLTQIKKLVTSEVYRRGQAT